VRSSFFAYQSEYRGGTDIVRVDLDNDGKQEVVIAENNTISILKQDKKLLKKFYPYTENYRERISFNVGDLDGDGKLEIVTGTGEKGGPHVRIFDSRGNLKRAGFFAYNKNFRGGVNVACGDVDGDGRDEIITGAGFTGGPHVRIFDVSGGLKGQFFAFNPQARTGVKVVANDLDGDGRDEIIGSSTSVFTTAIAR